MITRKNYSRTWTQHASGSMCFKAALFHVSVCTCNMPNCFFVHAYLSVSFVQSFMMVEVIPLCRLLAGPLVVPAIACLWSFRFVVGPFLTFSGSGVKCRHPMPYAPTMFFNFPSLFPVFHASSISRPKARLFEATTETSRMPVVSSLNFGPFLGLVKVFGYPKYEGAP